MQGARADGYAARLAGTSRYSNPYSDRIERRDADGRRSGWLYAMQSAWWLGWQQADEVAR
jgi:hypothetical protein